jgi:predicted transcriptional regulator
MAPTKISSQVDEEVWRDFQELARESHQSISGMLTEAIRDYLRRKRVRPEVMDHLQASIAANEELGRKLAE